ncbi:MAG: M23 family metallopeptidase [Anaerolineales bacterium]|nr:MAG: M23 family metallopeptidase [Anaerolineales bacterium]
MALIQHMARENRTWGAKRIRGKVTYAGWNYYLGWTVVIENEGWHVILGHLCCGPSGKSSAPTGPSSINVGKGDIVQARSVVGTSGTTGSSTGPHLHFEVRKCDQEGQCRVINPKTVLLPGQDAPWLWESFSDSPPSRCLR